MSAKLSTSCSWMELQGQTKVIMSKTLWYGQSRTFKGEILWILIFFNWFDPQRFDFLQNWEFHYLRKKNTFLWLWACQIKSTLTLSTRMKRNKSPKTAPTSRPKMNRRPRRQFDTTPHGLCSVAGSSPKPSGADSGPSRPPFRFWWPSTSSTHLSSRISLNRFLVSTPGPNDSDYE